MSTDDRSSSEFSPDDAFALVADETRLEILRTLSETTGPLSFSALFERSDYENTSNFSYHLDKLEGHFVTRTADGYALRQTGRRIVEAVLSGTVTDDPVVKREPIDNPCPICSAPIEISYQQERVELYCTDCPGFFNQTDVGEQFANDFGTLGHIYLPPAGIQGRTPTEIHTAAVAWSNLEVLGLSAGICPRCAGTIDHSMTVCPDHTTAEDVCDHCDRRYAARFDVDCSTCHYESSGIPNLCLLATTELLDFLTDHGLNPLLPETHDRAPDTLGNYDEEVRSTDPLRVALTYTVDDDALTLLIDDDAAIVDATREPNSRST
jgi:DNA-binding transcriptional ArsR family regulator